MPSLNPLRPAVPAAALLAAALIGCAGTPTLPAPQPDARPLAQAAPGHPRPAGAAARPTVALVLGGGGLRGFAHLGVLRALEEAGVRPDLVVGTSVGAVVGAAYASGKDSAQLEAAAGGVRILSLIDLTLSQSGIMRGERIAGWIDALTAGVPMESFPMRFAAVATDLGSGAPMLLDRGPAGIAVQASAAVPGVNVPVAYRQGHLVDGGVSSLVPVRAARALGADFVIAVDIYCRGPRAEGLGALTVLGRAMQAQNCAVAAPEMAEADVLIAPRVQVPGMSARAGHLAAIEAGYGAARAALPAIVHRAAGLQ
jgi:NTE family protein